MYDMHINLYITLTFCITYADGPFYAAERGRYNAREMLGMWPLFWQDTVVQTDREVREDTSNAIEIAQHPISVIQLDDGDGLIGQQGVALGQGFGPLNVGFEFVDGGEIT